MTRKKSKTKKVTKAVRKPRRKTTAPPEPPNASRTRARARKPGGQDTFTVAKGQAICAWLAQGDTLSDFCRQEGAPKWTTVHDWLNRHEDFKAAYDLARVIGAHAIAEQALRIADTPVVGEVETIEEDEVAAEGAKEGDPKVKVVTRKIVREDMLGHRKLQIETRLKLLAKWFPQHYGDKVGVDLEAKGTFEEVLLQALQLSKTRNPESAEGNQ